MAGMYVISNKLASKGTSQGSMAMVVLSTLKLATRASTNNTMPIGGCSNPIIKFNTITNPKCTGSMPN
jgi:hypothetical protein